MRYYVIDFLLYLGFVSVFVFLVGAPLWAAIGFSIIISNQSEK